MEKTSLLTVSQAEIAPSTWRGSDENRTQSSRLYKPSLEEGILVLKFSNKPYYFLFSRQFNLTILLSSLKQTGFCSFSVISASAEMKSVLARKSEFGVKSISAKP